MNIKGNFKFILIGSTVFLIVYLFVAAIPLGSDINFEPVWTIEISQDIKDLKDLGSPDENKQISIAATSETFILGDTFGYFSPDGTILKSTQTKDLIAASSFGWSINTQEAVNPILYSPIGEKILSITGEGNIHIDEDRIYLFRPGGDGVSQYSKEGKILWSREHIAPITAFNSSKAGTIIGYADGKLMYITKEGTTLFSIYPGGSNYQIILGVALSDDGKQIICLSGIEKQRILVISITGNQHKIVHHEYLETDARKNCFAHFTPDGNFAFVEVSGALAIIDCKKNEIYTVAVEGEIVSVGEDPVGSLFTVLSKHDSIYTLTAIERPNRIAGKTTFTAKNAFLIQRANTIYLGTDSKISRINIRGTK